VTSRLQDRVLEWKQEGIPEHLARERVLEREAAESVPETVEGQKLNPLSEVELADLREWLRTIAEGSSR
jgi:hypothetical protein